MHSTKKANPATNMLKMAPLSPPSVMDNPMAIPARIHLSRGFRPAVERIAVKARNVAARHVARLGSPQQALETKFMFNAAAVPPKTHTAPRKPSDRKNAAAHRPRTRRLSGTENLLNPMGPRR